MGEFADKASAVPGTAAAARSNERRRPPGRGNQATQHALRGHRERDAEHGRGFAKNVDAYAEIARSSPWLLLVLTAEQVREVQNRFDLRANNARVQSEIDRAKQRQRERDGPSYQYLSRNVDEIDRIERKFRSADTTRLELVVATERLLSPEFQFEPKKNIEAEAKFRDTVYEELAAKPTVIVFSLEQQARGFHLWWGREEQLPNHGGLVSFADLLEVPRFRDRYERDVRNSPAMTAVRTWSEQLKSGINAVMDEHRNRVELNREHPVVRRVAEFLGGPSFIEIVILQTKLQERPNDAEAKAKLHHLLGVSNATAPSLSEWKPILSLLDFAAQGIRETHPEGSALVLAVAQDLAMPLGQRVAEYEEKVLGGAGAAIGILERLKQAGEIAATFVGGGVASRLGYGLVGVAVGSGVAAGVNTSAQGVGQGWGLGYGEGVDLGAIAKRSAVDAVLTSFSTLVGGKLASAIETKLLALHLNPRMASVFSNVLGGAGSAALTAPANSVVRHLALSGQMPKSVDDLVDLIADEAIRQAIGGALFGAIAPVRAAGPGPSGGGSRPLGDTVSPTADTINIRDTVSPTADTINIRDTVSPTADTINIRDTVSPTADTINIRDTVSPTADTINIRDTVSPTADTINIRDTVSPTADTINIRDTVSPTADTINIRDTVSPTADTIPPPGTVSPTADTIPPPGTVSPTADTIPPPGTVSPVRPPGGGAGTPAGGGGGGGGGGPPGPAAAAPAVNLRNVVPPEPAKWWTDGSRVYEKVGGKWVYRGRPKITPDETIRGEVRANRETGHWEVEVEGVWYRLGPLPEIPPWARQPK